MKTKSISLAFIFLLFLGARNLLAETYTGEQLFQGVFFGTGPVAKLFPELYLQTPPSNVPEPNTTLLVSNLKEQAAILNKTGHPEDGAKLLRIVQRISNAPPNLKTVLPNAELHNYLMEQVRASDPTFLDRFAKEVQSGNAVRVAAAVREGADKLWRIIDTMPDPQYYVSVWWAFDIAVAIEAVAVLIIAFLAVLPLLVTPGAHNYQFDEKISLITTRLGAHGPLPGSGTQQWGIIVLIAIILIVVVYLIMRRRQR